MPLQCQDEEKRVLHQKYPEGIRLCDWDNLWLYANVGLFNPMTFCDCIGV